MLCLSVRGVMISPSLLCKRPFLALPCWCGPGKPTSLALMRFDLPPFQCLPPCAEGISCLPSPHPWVCTRGEIPPPPKAPSAGNLEELSLGSTQPQGSQVEAMPPGPVVLCYSVLLAPRGRLFVAWLPAAGFKTPRGCALCARNMSCLCKNPAGWPCQMLTHRPGWKG